MLWYLLPEGSSVKSVCEGFVGSSAALQMQWVRYVFVMEGRKAPVIFSAVLTSQCRILQSNTVQLPYQIVMQLLRMLSIVPL